MKKQIIYSFLAITVALFTFSSCDPDAISEDALYTFKGEMVGKYLENNPGEFSEFTELLDTTKVLSLLNSYGSYTCFAPTNEAMFAFYKEKGKKSLSDFPLSTLKNIAYDHVINGSTIINSDFTNGRLPVLTMSDRFITLSVSDTAIYVDYSALITLRDIVKNNGVVHKINKVLDPSRDNIVTAISKQTDFSIFYEALVETGMSDSLLKIQDDTYNKSSYNSLIINKKEANNWDYQEIPEARRFRYTVLMESNITMNANQIYDLTSLKEYAARIYDEVYPEDAHITNIKDRRNSLNRFISYHLINKQLSKFTFIDAYDTNHMLKDRDMYEYIETMCPNTLLEVKKDRLANKTNLFNYIKETGEVIQLSTSFFDKTATNGVYHEIDGMLVYNKRVDNQMSSKRLRFDSSSFFPELTNNNMRGSRYNQNVNTSQYNEQSLVCLLPRGYVDRIKSSEQTVVGYLPGYHRFQNYESDEIFLNASSGKLYDFEIITPPIPAGTYEVRFGYLTNGKRGVAQLYFDKTPCGVPLNLNKNAKDNGWELPGSIPDDLFGFENDKVMRNNGYMKAPACFKVITPGWTSGENARFCDAALRRILGTYTFNEAGHHLLTVKGLSGGEFMFDYMEFVPTSALEGEDIY